MLRFAFLSAVALALGGYVTDWDPSQHGLREDNTPSIEAQLSQLPMDLMDATSVGKLNWKTIATHPAWRSAPIPDWRGDTRPDDPWRIALWRERFFPMGFLRFELREGKFDAKAHRIVFRSTALAETDCTTLRPKLVSRYGQPSDVARVKFPQEQGGAVLDEAQWKVGLTSISSYCISGSQGASIELRLLLEPSEHPTPLLRSTNGPRIP